MDPGKQRMISFGRWTKMAFDNSVVPWRIEKVPNELVDLDMEILAEYCKC